MALDIMDTVFCGPVLSLGQRLPVVRRSHICMPNDTGGKCQQYVLRQRIAAHIARKQQE
jgi:hypothetical protein